MNIIELYSKRWDIEVSYKTMKTTQEIERHISLNGDVARNDIYAKVLFHNIVGVLRKEINHELEKRQTSISHLFEYSSMISSAENSSLLRLVK